MPDPTEPDNTKEDKLGDEIRQFIEFGSGLLRNANQQLENHLSKTVDDFQSGRAESWQRLYEKLWEKYGDQLGDLEKTAADKLSGYLDTWNAESHEPWFRFDDLKQLHQFFEEVGSAATAEDIQTWLSDTEEAVFEQGGTFLVDPNWVREKFGCE